ncbi:MAG: Gfo/Idh/MocA family oxidoreductase [Gemmatimonadetes bacterium]|nr:Gfo/Idh/MocA family oxidoreductase [Gemmatimonadota bacterium]
MTRLGLLGTGRHGVRYAQHLRAGDIEGAELRAIGRRDHEAGRALAGEWGVAYCESAAEMAARDDVDALLVVSQSHHHLDAVRAAANHRKPALIEKPLAMTVRECDEIAALVRDAKIPAMVAQTTRYEGPVAGLLAALPRIGAVRQISFVLTSEDRTHDEAGSFAPRLDDGGAILDSGVHYFDLLGLLVDPVAWVSASPLHVRGTHLDDGYSAVLETRAGVRVTINMGRWGKSRHEFVEVAGDEGILHLSRTPPSLALIEGRARVELPFPEVPGTIVPTLEDFVRVARGEIESPIPIEAGREAVRIAEACCQSGGRRIDLE